MNPHLCRAALIVVLAAALPAGASQVTQAAGQPGEEKGMGPPRQDAGIPGSDPATELPRPAEPKTAEPKTAEPKTAEPKTAEPPTGAGSAAGAPGAPGTPGTASATDASVPRGASPAAGAPPFLLQIVGTIQRVDPGARAIQLASADVRLELAPGAEVIRNGRPATLAQVREGDRIRATTPGAPDLSKVRELDVTSAR